MKKKKYLQPDVEDIGMLPFQLMDASRGWSRDANPPTPVEMEESVNENDKLPSSSAWDEYGGFLDLD